MQRGQVVLSNPCEQRPHSCHENGRQSQKRLPAVRCPVASSPCWSRVPCVALARHAHLGQLAPAMKNGDWKLWNRPRMRRCESRLLRYGVAIALPVVAAFLTSLRPAFRETPFFVFLAAIVLSAANGGVAAAVCFP